MTVRFNAETGTWFFRFLREGRPHYRGRFRTKAQADVAQVRYLDKLIESSLYPEKTGQGLTVKEATDLFFTEYSRKLKRSWDIDKARLPVIAGFFETKKLSQVSSSDVEGLREALLKKGLKPLTVNHHVALLKAMYNWLGKTGRYSGPNPAANVQPFKIARARVRYLLLTEERVLSDAISARYPRLWAYYVVALHTGMRLSEICALRGAAVSHENRTLFVPDSKNGTSRHVPISPALLEFFVGGGVERLGSFTRFTVSHWFSRVAKEAGLVDLCFHDLRHTFAQRLLSKGVPIYLVSKILGHSSVTVTEAHYGHLGNKELQEAAQKIDGVVELHESCKEVGVGLEVLAGSR